MTPWSKCACGHLGFSHDNWEECAECFCPSFQEDDDEPKTDCICVRDSNFAFFHNPACPKKKRLMEAK